MVMGIVMKLYQKFSELTLSLKMIVISMSLSQQPDQKKEDTREMTKTLQRWTQQ